VSASFLLLQLLSGSIISIIYSVGIIFHVHTALICPFLIVRLTVCDQKIGFVIHKINR